MRLEPQFFQRLAFGEARHTALQQEQAGSLATCGWVGFGHHNHQVRVPPVGDVSFAAVEHKRAIGLRHGRGFDALQITSSRRFCHCNRAHHVATRHGRQIALLLRLRAVVLKIGRDDFGMQTVAYAAETGRAQFLHLNDGIQLVSTKTTIGLGLGHAQKTQSTGLGPDLLVHIALLFPSGMVGCNFFCHETAKTVAKRLMFRAEKCAFDHACLQRITRGKTLERIFL